MILLLIVLRVSQNPLQVRQQGVGSLLPLSYFFQCTPEHDEQTVRSAAAGTGDTRAVLVTGLEQGNYKNRCLRSKLIYKCQWF